MPSGFLPPKSENEISKKKIGDSDNYKILHEEENSKEIHVFISASQKSYVKINIAYFPAWTGFLDNKRVDLIENKTGMLANLPAGNHSLDLFFVQTPIEKLGNSLTLVALFILFAGIILLRKRKYK